MTEASVLVDAIVGIGISRAEVGLRAQHTGMATFTGDQHNERWEWNREALTQLSLDTLQALYEALRASEERHAH